MKSTKNKLKKIVIVGGGGLGKEVLMTVLDCNKKSKIYDILGFIDDKKILWKKSIHGFPVLGGINWFKKNNSNIFCVIAIGDTKIRKKIVSRLEKMQVHFFTLMHPSVICSNNVNIGIGTIIQAGSIINPDVQIGSHCKIDTNCSIAHESILEDFVTLSPRSTINGVNKIETGVFIGSGTTTIEDIKIGKWSITGAGTVLTKNVPSNCLYTGIPGKLRTKLK